MIGWGDVYNVAVAMTPLYVALALGYFSMKWWRIFTPEQCMAINRFVTFFTLPFYTFQFISNFNPFTINFRFILADALSKAFIIAGLGLWVLWNGRKSGGYGSSCDWSITNFAVAALPNTLVVGVPLLRAMYGPLAQDLSIQMFVVQVIVWFTILIFILEFRRTRVGMAVKPSDSTDEELKSTVNVVVDQPIGTNIVVTMDQNETSNNNQKKQSESLVQLIKIVFVKLLHNPNSYASLVGLAWALMSHKLRFRMPRIVEDSVLIMSNGGAGTAMFSMGLFMALQKNIMACGVKMTFWGFVLKFIAGPLTMGIASFIVRLHGLVFKVGIVQAALPASIICFIYARDYGLHAEVLSTAVSFGTLMSLPVLIAYYVCIEYVM